MGTLSPFLNKKIFISFEVCTAAFSTLFDSKAKEIRFKFSVRKYFDMASDFLLSALFKHDEITEYIYIIIKEDFLFPFQFRVISMKQSSSSFEIRLNFLKVTRNGISSTYSLEWARFLAQSTCQGSFQLPQNTTHKSTAKGKQIFLEL